MLQRHENEMAILLLEWFEVHIFNLIGGQGSIGYIKKPK